MVDVPEGKEILVDSTGIAIDELVLSLPGERDFKLFGALQVQTQEASLAFNSDPAFARLQGTFLVPSLGKAQIDLAGDHYLKISETGVTLNGEITIPGPIDITQNGKWNIRDVVLDANTNEGHLSGLSQDHDRQRFATVGPAWRSPRRRFRWR